MYDGQEKIPPSFLPCQRGPIGSVQAEWNAELKGEKKNLEGRSLTVNNQLTNNRVGFWREKGMGGILD